MVHYKLKAKLKVTRASQVKKRSNWASLAGGL
jgi:hypothetical protein